MSGPAFLVDTNVWLDVYLPNRTNQASSVAFFDAASFQNVKLLASVGTIKDVYLIMEAAIQAMANMSRPAHARISEEEAVTARNAARAYIENLLEIADVLDADENDVVTARNLLRIHHRFDDNLLIAAAQRARVDYLVSNNTELVARSPIAAVTAQDATLLLNMGAGY